MNSSFEDSELLKYAIENGIIDLDAIRNAKEMNERQEMLSLHPYAIWQGADGYYRTYIIENGKRVQRKRKELKAIEDLVISIVKPQSNIYTIEKAFNEWNDRNLDLSKISQATHIRNIQTYNRHYKEFGKQNLETITPEEFEEFLEEEVCRKHLKAKAYANLKGITRGFLRRAKKQKHISFNIEDMFEDVDISNRDFGYSIKDDSDEVFDEEETPIIMKYLSDNPDMINLGILLMFVTGIRIGELVTLKHDVFSRIDDTYCFLVCRTETRYLDDSGWHYDVKEFPKTPAGYRRIIIPTDYQWIYKELRRINPFSEYVFMQDDKRLTVQYFRKRLSKICKELGIKQRSPHKIRKTYASILLDAGVDSQVITSQMGHTDIATTERHYHRNRKNLESKRIIIDSVDEFKIV